MCTCLEYLRLLLRAPAEGFMYLPTLELDMHRTDATESEEAAARIASDEDVPSDAEEYFEMEREVRGEQ